MRVVNLNFQIVLTLLSLYFVKNEIVQLFLDGFAYFGSLWNYLDLCPPIIIFILVFIDYYSHIYPVDDPSIRSLMAWATLLMWFKMLYFLRIFPQTGYLIRMVVEVVIDMKYFLVLLFLGIFGFSDAFLTISMGNEE